MIEFKIVENIVTAVVVGDVEAVVGVKVEVSRSDDVQCVALHLLRGEWVFADDQIDSGVQIALFPLGANLFSFICGFPSDL